MTNSIEQYNSQLKVDRLNKVILILSPFIDDESLKVEQRIDLTLAMDSVIKARDTFRKRT